MARRITARRMHGSETGSLRWRLMAFDFEDPYVLTSLGQQFVHYTMTELVPRIGKRGLRAAGITLEGRERAGSRIA